VNAKPGNNQLIATQVHTLTEAFSAIANAVAQ